MQADIQAVESTVFASFSAQLGISNIREYESTTIKRHQQLLAQQSGIAKQAAELSAQLQYELKKDFAGTLERISTSIQEANSEFDKLTTSEQKLLHTEIATRGELKTATEHVSRLQLNKATIHATLRALQSKRAALLADRDSVSKKINDVEIMIERYRTSLHDILQKARVDEVALPTIANNTSATNTNANNTTVMDTIHESDSSSSRRNSSASNTNTNTSNSRDDLYWEGSDSNSRRGEYCVLSCVYSIRMCAYVGCMIVCTLMNLVNVLSCIFD